MRILASDNINGILGTIIFHLILVLFFLLVKVGDVRRKQMEYFPIEFEEELIDIEEIIKEIESMQAEIQPLGLICRRTWRRSIFKKHTPEPSPSNTSSWKVRNESVFNVSVFFAQIVIHV